MAELLPPATSAGLLAQLALPGNEPAWKRFVDSYRGYTEFSCRKAGLQEEDVQEITSRVLFALFKRLPQFQYDPSKRFRGYLTQVIRNEIISYFKELQKCPGSRGQGAGENGEQGGEWSIPAELDQFAVDTDSRVHEGLVFLERALARVQALVEPETWEVFRRTALLSQPATLVASEVGKSIDAVYMAKSRLLKLVKKEIERLKGQSVSRGPNSGD